MAVTCVLVAGVGETKRSFWSRAADKGKEMFSGVGRVFKTGSFLIILVGNIISVIVGLGLGYKIMYLQVGPLHHGISGCGVDVILKLNHATHV